MHLFRSDHQVMMRQVRRWLYLAHRWIGIATCLLFAVWFLSGLVMAYVPFPHLTEAERLAGEAPIDWARVRHLPPVAWVASPAAPPRLVMLRDMPVWRHAGDTAVISAETGRRVEPTSSAQAMAIAQRFGHAPDAGTAHLIVQDQWTVAGGFDRYRPMWRVDPTDRDGVTYYVAAKTGEVVLDTSRWERGWNWIGSIPHWIYFTALRQHQPLWRQAILWTAGLAMLGAVTGAVVGILRLRLRLRLRRRYRGGAVTPYHGWQKWHHLAGMVGGLALVTWIFSGWLSVDPNHWFASQGLPDDAYAAFAGPVVSTFGRSDGMSDGMSDPGRLAANPQARAATEMRLRQVDGRLMFDLRAPHAPALLLDAATLATVRPAETDLVAAAARMLPTAAVVEARLLAQEDDYYYSQDGSRKLPILRICFNDPARRWLYIDPATAEILYAPDRIDRAYRWWFDALHRLDFGGFSAVRPAWDVLIWILSACGLVISASGILIGWRRLRGRPQYSKRRVRPDTTHERPASGRAPDQAVVTLAPGLRG